MRRFDFPLLKTTTFLDTAAGSLKPTPVLEEINKYYNEYPMNPHSIDSKLGSLVYSKLLDARKTVADLVDATPEEVIFTSGTTDGLNRVGRMFEKFVKSGDEIIVSKYNHSSNFAVWVELANRTGAKVIISDNILDDINEKTKVVAYAQVNNSLHQENNPDEIADAVEKVGAVLVNDAAQAIVHEKVSLDNSDVIVFSSTKIYGPTGAGALIIKKELLDLLDSVTTGGGAVAKLSSSDILYKDSIARFEAGTPNTAGIIGMAAGIKYMNEYDDFESRKELSEYAFNKLNELENIEVISKPRDGNVIFRVKNASSQDVVSYLGHRDIILRAGKHCALYLFESLDISDTIRMSFGIYNNTDDIDKAVEAIKNGGDFIEGL